MIERARKLVMAVFGLSSCSLRDGPTRHGEMMVLETAGGPTMAVQVLPTRLHWRKPGASYDDMVTARVECSSQLRLGGEYVDLLKESEPITLASMQRTITRVQKKRKREIDKRLSELYTGCIASKGYEYIRGGFPFDHMRAAESSSHVRNDSGRRCGGGLGILGRMPVQLRRKNMAEFSRNRTARMSAFYQPKVLPCES